MNVASTEGGIQHELLLLNTLFPLLPLLLDSCKSHLPVCDLYVELIQGDVGRIYCQASRAGIGCFDDLVESEESERGAIVGFDIMGIETKGGRAVKGCGSVVL